MLFSSCSPLQIAAAAVESPREEPTHALLSAAPGLAVRSLSCGEPDGSSHATRMAPAAIAKAMGVHGGIEEEVPDFFADGGFLALLFLPIDVRAMHDGKDFVWLQNNTANKHRRGQTLPHAAPEVGTHAAAGTRKITASPKNK